MGFGRFHQREFKPELVAESDSSQDIVLHTGLNPQRNLAAHLVGYTDVDGNGKGGIERYFDARLKEAGNDGKPLALGLDVRVQHALRDEIARAIVDFRALGGADDPASRVENRIGEPAANPYLYMASQIISGLDGMDRGKDPADPAETPYDVEATALPRSLMEAVTALRQSDLFREQLGDRFVEYILGIKEAEIARFLSEVTDWEHREYFELF